MFTEQIGFSTIDGEMIRPGIFVDASSSALSKFIIMNGVTKSHFSASGIFNLGTLSIRDSIIHSNVADTYGYVISSFGDLFIINTTIANNISGGGTVLLADGSAAIKNSTISQNKGVGVVSNTWGYVYIQNSILAQNTYSASDATPLDCSVSARYPISLGYNLIQNNKCGIETTTGDKFNINPYLGKFNTERGYVPLLPNSPAIDAGNPAIPGSESNACETVDQFGTLRPIDGDQDSVATCDMGAYETTAPGAPVPSHISIIGEANRNAPINIPYAPLSVAVEDQYGMPLAGAVVDFLAPDLGPSGSFVSTGTNQASATTDVNGVTISPQFIANSMPGQYILEASASGGSVFAEFSMENFLPVPATIQVYSGDNQNTAPDDVFQNNLEVVVRDDLGRLVGGVLVTFRAPDSGPSGVFSDTNGMTTTASTDQYGIATAAPLNANSLSGIFNVEASIPELLETVQFTLTNVNVWYVANIGNDLNDCQTKNTPCKTINNAIDKAEPDDAIKVAGGVYTADSGVEVVNINKNIKLSGGWDPTFTTQNETTSIDGQSERRCITVIRDVSADVDRFVLQNGFANQANGGAVLNDGTFTINESIIRNNKSSGSGGGIVNKENGVLIVNSTRISNNEAGGVAGGIWNVGFATVNNSSIIYNDINSTIGSGIYSSGTLNLNNSTISHNTRGGGGLVSSGIYAAGGIVKLNHVTITKNSTYGIETDSNVKLYLQNTIIADNPTDGWKSDCKISGETISLGYNLIGESDFCSISPTTGDQFGTSSSRIRPRLGEYLVGLTGYHVLTVGSPAIDSASPTSCLQSDQRGLARPQGSGCDIGAYEYTTNTGPAFWIGPLYGSDQESYVGRVFLQRMAVFAIDEAGTPVSGAKINFAAPTSEASLNFLDTLSNISTAQTDGNGIALSPSLRANYRAGSYLVDAGLEGHNNIQFFFTNLSFYNPQANILQNGDFENTTSLGNYWSQFSTRFGTPLCIFALCGNGGGTAGPRSGNTWVWFGGVPFPFHENASISQSVVIPKGPAYLRFYFWIGAVESGVHQFGALVDGEYVLGIRTNLQSQYSTYKLVEVDVSKYADGASHLIKFEAFTYQAIANINLDDVSLNASLFGDVAPDYWAWNQIERLYSAGITGGCSASPLAYCPDNTVTRAQMAVFLEKGTRGPGFTPSPATGTRFNDVPVSHWAAAWVEQLAADGITGGCGAGNYCPDNPVTRAQMAVFLLKSKYGSSYSPPAVDESTGFGDVAAEYWAAAWIKQLAAEGITGGCGAGNYCPEQPVTRAQMAVFIVKTFGLP